MKRRGFKRLEVELRARHIEFDLNFVNKSILVNELRGGPKYQLQELIKRRTELEDEIAELYLLEDEIDER